MRSLLSAPEQTLPETDSDESLAERFSANFRNKISGVRASLDLIHTLPTQPEEICIGRMLREFVPIIETSLRKIILRSPPKSCDDDPVPAWLLREGPVLDAILSALTAAVNESQRSGTVEPCLKSALVRPLLKLSRLDSNITGNYRPVSNLLFLSKVLEKVVTTQVTKHLTENDLLDPFQSAYRAGHSTETALTRVKRDIDMAIDNGKGVILVMLDLSAAFDTIDHGILIQLLEKRCGVTRLAKQWIMWYLEDRKQTLIISGSRSVATSVTVGVPQGSVLGPLLFSVYLTPLPSIIESYAIDHHCYADDRQLYTTFSPREPGTLQDSLHRIERLCE